MIQPSLDLAECCDLAYDDPTFIVRNVACRILPRDGVTVVAFAGSNDCLDWIQDLCAFPRKRSGRGSIHDGFADMFDECRRKLLQALQAIKGPIKVVGHSAGGPLALQCAGDAKEAGLDVVEVQVLACPHVGDKEWAAYYRKQGIPTLRIIHGKDPIPNLPPLSMGYVLEADALVLGDNGQVLASQDLPANWRVLAVLVDALKDHPMPGYLKAIRLYLGL